MPPLPAVPNVLRYDFLQSMQSQPDIQNRLYFAYTGGPPSPSDLLASAVALAASWHTNMHPHQVPELTLNAVRGIDLNSNTGAVVVANAGTVGTFADDPQGLGVALVVQFKIARRYRGGKPRLYMAGPPFGAIVGATGAWGAGYTAAVLASFQAMVAGFVGTTFGALTIGAHHNVSYFSGFHNVTLPSGRETSRPTVRGVAVVDQVTGYAINPRPASQRRRNGQSR